MLTLKELEIIELFRKDIFAEFSIREIMKKINTKSYSWTHNAVNKLHREEIVTIKRIGQSKLCKINLESQLSISYLSLLEELNALDKKIANISKIMKLVNEHGFYILMVTGSYANNKFTEKSDLDVVAIIDRKEEKKWISNKLANEGDLMIPKMHPYVFTKEEFLEMLTNKESNYGKEIAGKHLIFCGAEFYFRILRAAIKNGYSN
jgi:predicted nucleotidyltransferase